MTPPERWLPVVGLESTHEVSDQGRVRRGAVEWTDKRGWTRRDGARILKTGLAYGGYSQCNLTRGGKRAPVRVHTLVLESFVGPKPFPHAEGLHKDGNPQNNALSNLRWGTHQENMRDMLRHGRNPMTRRTHCPRNHPLIEPNLSPSQSRIGRRSCLACCRARSHCRKHPTADLVEVSNFYYQKITGEGAAVMTEECARRRAEALAILERIGQWEAVATAEAGAKVRALYKDLADLELGWHWHDIGPDGVLSAAVLPAVAA